MKKFTVALSFILLAAIGCFSQQKIDLSGTWKLAKEISGSQLMPKSVNTLVITQTGEQLKLVKTEVIDGQSRTTETILFLDGRSEENAEIKSTTTVKKDHIYREKKLNPAKQHEKYSLSKDGKTLRIFHSVLNIGVITFSPKYYEYVRET